MYNIKHIEINSYIIHYKSMYECIRPYSIMHGPYYNDLDSCMKSYMIVYISI